MGLEWMGSVLTANDCTIESFACVCVVLYLYTCALALLLGIYSGCFLLIYELNFCEGELFFPSWFSFGRVFCSTRPRFHRSHISNMRLDRLERLISKHPFTVFVSGADRTTVPIGMVNARSALSMTNVVCTSRKLRHHMS